MIILIILNASTWYSSILIEILFILFIIKVVCRFKIFIIFLLYFILIKNLLHTLLFLLTYRMSLDIFIFKNVLIDLYFFYLVILRWSMFYLFRKACVLYIGRTYISFGALHYFWSFFILVEELVFYGTCKFKTLISMLLYLL